MKDKLICIDSDPYHYGFVELTWGKEYHVEKYSKIGGREYINVINDKGLDKAYSSDRFTTLEIFRQIQLNN